MNDEARMTNDETRGRTATGGAVWPFVIRHWDFIRHSSFVIRHLALVFALLPMPATAQVPDTPAAAPASATPAAPKEQSKFLGKDVPEFDPGTEMLTWDGKTWNVNNNRVFQARFEKYLNAPEE